MEIFDFKELNTNQLIYRKTKLIKIWSFLGFFTNILIIYLIIKTIFNPSLISNIKEEFNVYMLFLLIIEYILAFLFLIQVKKLNNLKSSIFLNED